MYQWTLWSGIMGIWWNLMVCWWVEKSREVWLTKFSFISSVLVESVRILYKIFQKKCSNIHFFLATFHVTENPLTPSHHPNPFKLMDAENRGWIYFAKLIKITHFYWLTFLFVVVKRHKSEGRENKFKTVKSFGDKLKTYFR
jgi:hypothetical protein